MNKQTQTDDDGWRSSERVGGVSLLVAVGLVIVSYGFGFVEPAESPMPRGYRDGNDEPQAQDVPPPPTSELGLETLWAPRSSVQTGETALQAKPKTRDEAPWSRQRIRSYLIETAKRYNAHPEYEIDPALVLAVAKAESNLDPEAVSPAGAIGVMQLMPETAKEIGVDPTNVRENIEGGVWYLANLLRRYGGNEVYALAAYNAGMQAVESHRSVPPYAETQTYVKRVLAMRVSSE